MSTHIGAQPGDIAPTVLLPGDPLRARWIAETFLDDARCYSEVRGMYGFTGTWNGHPVSVQGSGMGQPSMAIYVNELFTDYDVQSIVRVGSCGAVTDRVGVRDVIIASGACTDSSMNRIAFHGIDYAPVADFGLLRGAVEAAEARDGSPFHVGLIFSSDSFYPARPELLGEMVRVRRARASRWRPARSTRSPPSTAAARSRSAPCPTTSSPARRPPRRSASRPSARWSRSR